MTDYFDSKHAFGDSRRLGPFRPLRLALFLLLIICTFAPGELGEVTRGSLTDAYIAVTVFVAATLGLFYGAKSLLGIDIVAAFRRARLMQIPFAAFLGALPGCGGAVVVVAAYSSGSVSMGAVVATLTATMGDAAFLLIAKRPDAALILLPVSFMTGIISGYIVDKFDKSRFEARDEDPADLLPSLTLDNFRAPIYLAYVLLILPGLTLGILDLAQVTFTLFWENMSLYLSLVGIGLGMILWTASPVKAMTREDDPAIARVAEETSFITAWVILAFLIFEYLVSFAGLDLQAWFNTVGVLLPLIAILVGFIPGCGPQILVTTFYINGLVPFAALIGNAISNDGDALFPALAINPRAAILATLYSAIPAMIVAYVFYFGLPNLL